jgi:hypothetical protein
MPELILIAEHHYRTAARHFWKHAVEACEDAIRREGFENASDVVFGTYYQKQKHTIGDGVRCEDYKPTRYGEKGESLYICESCVYFDRDTNACLRYTPMFAEIGDVPQEVRIKMQEDAERGDFITNDGRKVGICDGHTCKNETCNKRK